MQGTGRGRTEALALVLQKDGGDGPWGLLIVAGAELPMVKEGR